LPVYTLASSLAGKGSPAKYHRQRRPEVPALATKAIVELHFHERLA
jgi:hypothetical protein